MPDDAKPDVPGYTALAFFPPPDPLRAECDRLATEIHIAEGWLDIAMMEHNLAATTAEQRKQCETQIARLRARYDQLREALFDRRIREEEELERRRIAERN
jgi:hypothetical protein